MKPAPPVMRTRMGEENGGRRSDVRERGTKDGSGQAMAGGMSEADEFAKPAGSHAAALGCAPGPDETVAAYLAVWMPSLKEAWMENGTC